MPANRALSLRPRRFAVIQCLVASMLATILLAGLAVLIFWLSVRPRPIEYAVTRAVVRHFNVTQPPDAAVNATFYVSLVADNPNRRVSLQYDWVEVYVLYGGDGGAQLAVVDVAPFHQPRRNATRLDVRALARSVPVAEQAARELAHDLAAGEVSVDVRMRARVRFKTGLVRTRHYGMQVFCSPVVVRLSRSAPASQTKTCDVAIS